MAILSKQLRTDGLGEIYGHVFENYSGGIARQLFWSVTLKCAPVRWEEENWHCSFTTEWLVLPIARWSDLHGKSLIHVQNPKSVEASLYLVKHHPAKLKALSFAHVTGTHLFSVNIEAEVDIEGFGDLDGVGLPLELQGEAEFEGLVILPSNLDPKPDTPLKASEALKRFISLSELGEPEWQGFRYVFPPI